MRIERTLLAFVLTFLLISSVAMAASSSETTGAYLDDSVITTKVKAALVQESSLKSLEIKVVTENGVVTLSGSVPNQAQITKASEIARDVEGVKSVKNDLRLK